MSCSQNCSCNDLPVSSSVDADTSTSAGGLEQRKALLGNLRSQVEQIMKEWQKQDLQLEEEKETECLDTTQIAKPKSHQQWEELFMTLSNVLANDNVYSLRPLLDMVDVHGIEGFLPFSLTLLDYSLTGHLLAWAYEYADEDIDLLAQLLQETVSEGTGQMNTNPDPSGSTSLTGLIDYVNKQADYYECFPGNEKVGRAKVPVTSR